MSITDTINERVSYALINTKNITVDENGQRDVERRKAQFNKIMKNFDPLKVNDLKVALIDGTYFCFDGQMTMKVLKAKNNGKDLEVPCKIYHGLTLLETAELFCDQNKGHSPVKIGDILRVKAAYGDENAINFMRGTENAGVDISWNGLKSKNSITAISTAYDCFLRINDKDRYTAMIRCMKEAWDGLNENLDARLIKGMTELFVTYKDIDTDRLTKQLAKTRPGEIIRDAQIDRNGGARKYAVIILQVYNKNLREENRLPNRL